MTAPDPNWYDEHDLEKPVLLLAPPGCGKTQQLALWVGALIRRGWLTPPLQVLALSYSRKAKANLRVRLRDVVGPHARRYVSVNTFHGWAIRVLNAHGELVDFELNAGHPLAKRFEPLRKRHVRRCFEDDQVVQAVLRQIKCAGHPPDEIPDRLAQHSRAAADYHLDLLQQEVPYDFDDVIGQAQRLLALPEVAELYRLRFPAIIVDEVQDLSLSHLRLAMLHEPTSQVFAGDVAQGIFRFAGATPEAVLAEIGELDPRSIPLRTSYRSSPKVLQVVSRLGDKIEADPLSAADPSAWEGKASFTIHHHATSTAEAEWVIDEVDQLLSLDYIKTVAVMARTGERRRPVDDAFNARGLNVERWDDPTHAPDAVALLRRHVHSLPSGATSPATDLEKLCLEATSPEATDTRQAVQEACAALAEVARSTNEVVALVAQMRVESTPERSVGPGVHLLSGHIGKGQEFDAVIVIGLEEESLPFYYACKAEREGDGGAEVRDECAVLRVMASRARHHLAFSHASSVFSYGQMRHGKKASRFLADVADLAEPRSNWGG